MRCSGSSSAPSQVTVRPDPCSLSRAAGVISADELMAIDREVVALIDDAVNQAIAAPAPAEAELFTDAYVSY